MASIWESILEDARYAPSPHNVQPWKLRVISEREAILLYDPSRLIPDEDTQGSFTLAGFAILLEYMAVLTQGKGFHLTYRYNGNRLDPAAIEPTPLFSLDLVPSDQTPEFDPALVRQRRTSRLPYNDKPVPPEILTELSRIAVDYGQTYTFSQEPALVRWVVQLNCNTLFYDMDDDLTRREVASWVRYTRREAGVKKDGLAAFCLNIPGFFLRIFFRNHHILKLPLINPFLKWYYLQTMRGTTTVGWISGPFATPEDWLRTGQLLARVWLTLTQHGIYLHPFGSTITNPTAHEQLREKFQLDESTNSLWLIMRLGQSDEPPRSARLEVTDIILR